MDCPVDASNLVSSSSQQPHNENEGTSGGGASSSDLPLHHLTHSEPVSQHSDSSSSATAKPSRPTFMCTICGDASYGRHYGVVSCEGCKGFFKRTVRKNHTYFCRDGGKCTVDRRLRNRCQYCRFQKCIKMGMRQDVVQEYRTCRRRERAQMRPRRVTCMEEEAMTSAGSSKPSLPAVVIAVNLPLPNLDFCMQKLQNADKIFTGVGFNTPEDLQRSVPINFSASMLAGPSMTALLDVSSRQLIDTCEKELLLAAQYIRHCPCIGELTVEDQLALVKCAWNELHLSAMASRARSAKLTQALMLSSGLSITSAEAPLFGLGGLVERVCVELITKMVDLDIDDFEMSCLRGIVLFNPDAKGLVDMEKVEACRGILYSALEIHCYQKHPKDVTRFAKLLLRLPSLRSISLKCTSQLFFSRLFPVLPFDGIFLRLLGQQRPPRDLRLIAMDVETDEYWRRMTNLSNLFAGPDPPSGLALAGPMMQAPWGGTGGMPTCWNPQTASDEVSSSALDHYAALMNFGGHSSDSDVSRRPVSPQEPLS